MGTNTCRCGKLKVEGWAGVFTNNGREFHSPSSACRRLGEIIGNDKGDTMKAREKAARDEERTRCAQLVEDAADVLIGKLATSDDPEEVRATLEAGKHSKAEAQELRDQLDLAERHRANLKARIDALVTVRKAIMEDTPESRASRDENTSF